MQTMLTIKRCFAESYFYCVYYLNQLTIYQLIFCARKFLLLIVNFFKCTANLFAIFANKLFQVSILVQNYAIGSPLYNYEELLNCYRKGMVEKFLKISIITSSARSFAAILKVVSSYSCSNTYNVFHKIAKFF